MTNDNNNATELGEWDLGFDEVRLPTPEGLGPADIEALKGMPDSRINEAIASLPSAFREVLLLVDVNGLSYKEVAQMMGTPVGTVMSRLHRGRRLVREQLTERV